MKRIEDFRRRFPDLDYQHPSAWSVFDGAGRLRKQYATWTDEQVAARLRNLREQAARRLDHQTGATQ